MSIISKNVLLFSVAQNLQSLHYFVTGASALLVGKVDDVVGEEERRRTERVEAFIVEFAKAKFDKKPKVLRDGKTILHYNLMTPQLAEHFLQDLSLWNHHRVQEAIGDRAKDDKDLNDKDSKIKWTPTRFERTLRNDFTSQYFVPKFSSCQFKPKHVWETPLGEKGKVYSRPASWATKLPISKILTGRSLALSHMLLVLQASECPKTFLLVQNNGPEGERFKLDFVAIHEDDDDDLKNVEDWLERLNKKTISARKELEVNTMNNMKGQTLGVISNYVNFNLRPAQYNIVGGLSYGQTKNNKQNCQTSPKYLVRDLWKKQYNDKENKALYQLLHPQDDR